MNIFPCLNQVYINYKGLFGRIRGVLRDIGGICIRAYSGVLGHNRGELEHNKGSRGVFIKFQKWLFNQIFESIFGSLFESNFESIFGSLSNHFLNQFIWINC